MGDGSGVANPKAAGKRRLDLLWRGLYSGRMSLVNTVAHCEDERWMRRALLLARKGLGATWPNPCVGAVLVRDGKVVGQGWHRKAGEDHAEVAAIKSAGESLVGSTLYVTLEPCAAQGRTPPCTEAILRAGIARVVYAAGDPNPKMRGGGAYLASRGVAVCSGVLAAQSQRLNALFLHYLKHRRPWVIAKAAISLDGKLATREHHSQWISGEPSRADAHKLRGECDAIMVGAGTFQHDNPHLTVRHGQQAARPPLRVVVATVAPAFVAGANLLDGSAPSRIYVRQGSAADADWRAAGVEVVPAESMPAILQHLADEGRFRLLVEGGGTLFANLFEQRLVDELVLYQAPILLGGEQAPGLWQGSGVARVGAGPHLAKVTRRRLGADQRIRGEVVYPAEQ